MGSNHKKKPFFIVGIVLLIAGLADIKYKGLFYRFLPNYIQTTLDGVVDSLRK